ncbi:hypothetical protein WUBG_13847 [Wuchereria bancrofti]|uniref:Uncharacterized protein n=1 Tax=Wuchereria bancrofti TaxID=6293 RepID=J9EE13_WUCBA|nr:hypothetical protein WUBG_13847 [Wuchereria bancrofti]
MYTHTNTYIHTHAHTHTYIDMHPHTQTCGWGRLCHHNGRMEEACGRNFGNFEDLQSIS